MTKPRRRWRYVLAAFAVATGVFLLTRPVCWTAWIFHGVSARECPDGDFHQTLWANVYDAQRGHQVVVVAGARAHYATARSQYDRVGEVRRVRAEAALVDGAGHETPLDPNGGWTEQGGQRSATLNFPQVADGDYLVRVREHTPLGDGQVDVPLALYAPAKIHVITDRPLYQPGDLIKFRAVALRARDLVPLDGRPGHWEVRDPTGEILLEEKAPAGNWGVVAGTFPLDQGAPEGEWHVAWVSGDARDDVAVKVQPFVLPRFRIEAHASSPYYRAHDKPELKGRVVYSSGAPVANATLELSWNVGGHWPPPTSWLTKDLPQHATADKDGAFDLKLPEVPGDLQGQATLSVAIAATDASGDRVEGSASALLTEDAIAVSSVTELADGLVDGFNNRLFLRATSASGEVLAGTALLVKRAWDPDDPGVKTNTDEDGVAQLQIDPGPAVNVVIPPLPYRAPPPQPAVTLNGTQDLLAGEDPLVDQSALERIVPELASCARFSSDGTEVQLGLEVDTGGVIRGHGENFDALSDCAVGALKDKKLPPGKPRVYRLNLEFSDHALPQIGVSEDGVPVVPDALNAALMVAVQNARSCMPHRITSNGTLTQRGTWHWPKDSKTATVTWAAEPGEAKVLQACLQSKAATLALPTAGAQDVVGVAHVSISPSQEQEIAQPQATTMLGYELRVVAHRDGRDVGSTTVRLTPGTVPPLRMRATPVLAEAGGPLDIELLRGPNYEADLPEEAYLTDDRSSEPVKAKIDREARTTHFTLPTNAAGWFNVQAGPAHALVYVRSKAELTVSLKTEHDRYAPGQKAKLAVRTQVGGHGAQAAVGLFGVDESLSQLVPLPGPDDMSRVRPKIAMTSSAFGTLDGEALTLGRIRGANAAMATVLRVSAIPTAFALDGTFTGNSETTFDPTAALTDHFYEVLGELHDQTRAWEDAAPKDEKMHPPQMVGLWNKALAAVKSRGGNIEDGYGRRLRLSQLPPDLLALTDPRAVVVQGTRLPEDVESWASYVAKEKP